MQKPGPFIRTEALGHMNLPAELLYIIYSYIDNLRDAISLTITNEHLASVGHSRVYELICALHSSWAGDRIVCLGDYMTDDDLPSGMISQDELKSLYAAANPKYDDRSLYDVAVNNFAPVSLDGQRWLHYFHYNPSTRSYLRDHSRHRDYLFRTSSNYASSSPEEDKWSLCNLTKHEYVRADIIAMNLGVATRGPFIEGRLIRLEQILFSLICWSCDEGVNMKYEADLHRGAWAGDRIAINTLSRLSPPLDSGVWKDITIPVFKRLVDIYDLDCTDEEWYTFRSIENQDQSEDEERPEGEETKIRTRAMTAKVSIWKKSMKTKGGKLAEITAKTTKSTMATIKTVKPTTKPTKTMKAAMILHNEDKVEKTAIISRPALKRRATKPPNIRKHRPDA